MNFSRFFVFFFFTHVFSSFFRHFLFLFVSLSPHFFISFCVWPFIFLITSFLTQFPLPVYHKTLQLIPFWMRALPLYVLLLMDFVHLLSLFFSSFFLVSNTCVSLFLLSSLSITSRKDELKELLQSKKKTCLSIYLFVWHFFIFICLCIFCFFEFFRFILMCFWTFFFLSSRSWMFFPLSLPFFMYLFFWRPCLVWSSFFFPFFLSFYILSLLTRMLNGDFQSDSIACVVDTSHSARQADMDDMVMKRSAANKRDKTSKQNKDESRIKSSLSLHFKPQKKFSQKAFIFCLCFTFSFNMFTVSFITVVFVHFLHSPFCSSLFLFSPFSFLSFLHSFFFWHFMFPNLFLHRRFCVSSFCCTSLFFSLFCSWSLLHTSSLHLFYHLRICYFGPKKIKKICGQFSRWNCLCLLNPPFFGV